MATPTIIVDGKSADGRRLSVSLDAYLWSLYVSANNRSESLARKQLRNLMESGHIENSFQAKQQVYQVVVRQDLLMMTSIDNA